MGTRKNHEQIVDEIDLIIENLCLGDFDYFQLTMLKVYRQAYLAKYKKNIEILHELEKQYGEFDNNIKKLIENSKEYRNKDPSIYIDKGHFKFDFPYVQFSLGYNYECMKKYSLALDLYDRSYEIWKSKNIKLYINEIIKTLNNSSNIFYNQYKDEISLEYLLKAFKYTTKLPKKEEVELKIMLLRNIALRYLRVEKKQKAINVISKALDLSKLISNQNQICSTQVRMGEVILHINTEKALNHFYNAYKKYPRTDLHNTWLLNILFHLGIINFELKKYEISFRYLEEMDQNLKQRDENIHYQRFNFLKIVHSIETNYYNLANPTNKLIELFYSENLNLEVNTLVILHIIKYMREEKISKYEITKLKKDILKFARKHKIIRLTKILDTEKINKKLLEEVKIKQLPLLEIREG